MHAVEQYTPLMDAVVSLIHEGVILADCHGRVLYQNPAASELLGRHAAPRSGCLAGPVVGIKSDG